MIEVTGIEKTFAPRGGGFFHGEAVHALRGVSLSVKEGGSLAIIGESGCGKTTLGRILCGLEPYDDGDVIIDGIALSELSLRKRQQHFRTVQMIHQDPYAALNPVRTIERTLTDPLKLHAKQSGQKKAWVRERARELLSLVGLDPNEVL